jgi:CRP/FNR family cyclic AMP-dependent transcriptional regulator
MESEPGLNATAKSAGRVLFYRECLCVNPMFAGLSDTALNHLAGVARLVTFKDNDPIVSRGDEIRYAAVVLTGGIRSSTTSADGCELSMSILRRGAFHGVMGVPEPTTCPWDCFAVGRTEVVAIYCSDFRAAVSQYPDIALLLAKLLNYRLKKAYSLISNATLQSLDTRLRRTLAMLASDVGGAGEQVDIKITQQALGHFVQCTRPTINKALKDLERTGAIKIGYGQIRILDVKALRSEIEGEALYVL